MERSLIKKYHLSLHVTSKATDAMIFSSHGELISKAFAQLPQYNPEAGWIQSDAEEIWRATGQAIHEAIAKAGLYAAELCTVSIASERGTAMLWDRISKEALTPVIARQCKRTKKITEDWKRKRWDRLLLQRTGLPVDDCYSAPKLVWLLAQYPQLRKRAKKGEVLFGTLDSWILWKMSLGQVHATDFTNAAATMLFDVRAFRWDKRLLARLNIPKQMMPQVKPSAAIFGKTELQGSLPEGIPIAAVAADQNAALFALTGLQKGVAKASYDADCHVMINIGGRPKFSKKGLATTVACATGKRATYILEGLVPRGGWPVHWLRDSLHLIDSIAETSGIAEAINDAADLYLIPQDGNGKSAWVPGGLLGLHSDVSKGHLVRAALQSVAFQTRHLLNTVAKDGRISIRSVFVDGPMSQNDFLIQFQANISNLDIARIKLGETACLGASYLACLAVKQIKSPASIQRLRPIDQRFRSKLTSRQRKKLLSGWDRAVKTVRKT